MAAFKNQSGPDLDLFFGQSWADWQTAVEADAGKTTFHNIYLNIKPLTKYNILVT